MGESVWHDIALGLPLQSVVANGGRRLHRRLHIAGFDEFPSFLRVIRPHSGKAVSLQFYFYLDPIGVDLIATLLHRLDLGQDSQEILHVMPDLMSNDVGL